MIKIIVDSAADFSNEEAENLGIKVIPMAIRFNQEEYLDGVDITKIQFFEKLVESDELPKTSQINPNTFDEAYKEIIKNNDKAIVITLSSKLSGTYQNARLASLDYEGSIYVIDSYTVTAGEKILALYALELISKGLDIQDVVEELERKKSKINVIAALATLKYLKKGGRISPLVAGVGEMLMIKPVVAIKNGEVKLLGKARGSKNANSMLTKMVSEHGIDFTKPISGIYSGLSDALLNKYIEDNEILWKGQVNSIPYCLIGATVGTHIGPGAIGFVFFEK